MFNSEVITINGWQIEVRVSRIHSCSIINRLGLPGSKNTFRNALERAAGEYKQIGSAAVSKRIARAQRTTKVLEGVGEPDRRIAAGEDAESGGQRRVAIPIRHLIIKTNSWLHRIQAIKRDLIAQPITRRIVGVG